MKKLVVCWLACLAVMTGVSLRQVGAMTFNGVFPGGSASATPFAVGTSTPVVVLTCASTLYSGVTPNPVTLYIDFNVTGGTAGTDGCYFMPQAVASPCASPSPAPNASTKVGMFVPTGGAGWNDKPLNFPSAGGGNYLSSEWTAVCTTASMYVSVNTFP